VVKSGARKVRIIRDGAVLVGFAGSTADAIALLERFEKKLDTYGGHLRRAAVELSKEWRTDKVLRRLESMLLVADQQQLLMLTGNGDVLEPDGGICGVGSGSGYAVAAARALVDATDLEPREIVERSLRAAADICIYTNHEIEVVDLEVDG